MSAPITEDIRNEIDRKAGGPVYLVDAERAQNYVLIPAEAYERIRALFGGNDPFDISETYVLQDRAADAAWSQPGDADYDNYDAHRVVP